MKRVIWLWISVECVWGQGIVLSHMEVPLLELNFLYTGYLQVNSIRKFTLGGRPRSRPPVRQSVMDGRYSEPEGWGLSGIRTSRPVRIMSHAV